MSDGQAAIQPSQWANRLLATFYPARMIASPVNFGLERIPDTRPLLFVGNHTLLGCLLRPLWLPLQRPTAQVAILAGRYLSTGSGLPSKEAQSMYASSGDRFIPITPR